jgi:60 kDa SS-A/Ro ribonucleoprotein
MIDFTKHVSTRLQPHDALQDERMSGPTPSQDQARARKRSAEYWTTLDRFLTLGAEGGTLYVGEHPLTQATARAIKACLAEDGVRVVRLASAIIACGSASRNDAALFVLAMAAGRGDEATRAEALASLECMARAETHLFDWLLRRLS